MPRGGTPAQGLWMPPRVATLFVAAADSLDKCRAQADYICDGVADDVQINAALAALPASGGRVVLSEGTFVLADPIVFPNNNITIEGQALSASLVDGYGLATGEHAFVISGVTACQIKNLAVYTQSSGGLVCHCIFIEDAADNTLIDNVIIAESDSDGIHIEGTASDNVTIRDCWISSVDGHGINIVPDLAAWSLNFSIHDNFITATGGSGINFGQCAGHYYHKIYNNRMTSIGVNGIDYGIATVPTFGLMESEIHGNYIYNATTDGIRLLSDSDNNLIENNYISSCGGYGINIGGPTCGENRLMNNKLIGNVTGQIQDLGVHTQLPEIFIPVPNPSSNIGAHPCEQLTDGLEVVSRLNVCIPLNYQELVTCEAVVVPGDTGNMRRSVATDWGEIASGESYNIDSGAIAEGNVAVTGTQVEGIDIAAAFVGVGALGPGDIVGVAFTRHADDVLDTVDADCWLLGIRMRYV